MEDTFTQDFIAMDEMTTRIHMNPKEALGSLEHVRSKAFRNRETHIDADGGHFEVWLDKSVYDVFDELFGEHIRAYNENQKRKDRKILDANGDEVGGYIEKIQTGRRGKRKRGVYKNMPDGTKEAVGKGEEESQGQRILYELIVSAGNSEKKRDEHGQIVYDNDGHVVYTKRLPYDVHKAAVKKFYEQFEVFYPHLKLTTVAFHADEYYLNAKGVKEYGVEHAHLCFVPWADGYQRGILVQASISKALEQMGFKNGKDDSGVWHNAYWYFTQNVQKRFEEILQHEYVAYQKQRGAKVGENGFFAAMGCVPGLFFTYPAKGKNLTNLDPAVYREQMDTERQLGIAQAKLADTNRELGEKTYQLAKMDNMIDEKEKQFAEISYNTILAKEKLIGIHEKQQQGKEKMDKIISRCNALQDECEKMDKDLERYRRRTVGIAEKEFKLDIPYADIRNWMEKTYITNQKTGTRTTIAQLCLDTLRREQEERAKEEEQAAAELQEEIRQKARQIAETVQQSFGCDTEDDEYDDTGYGS